MRTDTIERCLTDTGMNAKAYARGPDGKDVMIFGIDVRPAGIGTVRFWPGAADLDVHPSKRHRQAVIVSEEGDRTLTRVVRFYGYPQLRDDPGEMLTRAMREFPVVTPVERTRWSCEPLDFTKANPSSSGYGNGGWWRVKTTAHVTGDGVASAFLLGMDETYHFISQLPAVCSSVKDAHELLRPPEAIGDGVLRQGEFFFVPCNPARVRALNQYAGEDPSRMKRGGIESMSSHEVTTRMWYHGHVYARGTVYDTRKGRHAPLQLETWHRVVRNREVVGLLAATRPRSWD